MANLIIKQMLQLRTQSIVTYTKVIDKKKEQQKEALKAFNKQYKKSSTKVSNFKNTKSYSGKTNVHNKRRIRKACNLLNQISKTKVIFNPITQKNFEFRLTFITLTIPDKVTDKTGKELYNVLLKPMLKHLQQVYKMNSYIWKAEYQKRGVIHYHLTTNVFIPHDRLRMKWNKLIYNNGFMSNYIKRYKSKNPNSTDIHKVYNEENMEIYLEKYISKDDNNENSINGKVWDCSDNLKAFNYFTTELNEQHINNMAKKELLENANSFGNDFYEIIFFNKPIIHKILTGFEHQIYDEYTKGVENFKTLKKANKLAPYQKYLKN